MIRLSILDHWPPVSKPRASGDDPLAGIPIPFPEE